jgi:translocation and assembly module TamA
LNLRIALVYILAFPLVLSACAAQNANGRRWINRVDVEGNTVLASDEVRRGLFTEATSWIPLAEKQWFDEFELEEDKQRVLTTYAERGFFSARVIDVRVETRTDGKSVNITLKVEEGPRTKLAKVSIEGLPEGDWARLHKAVDLNQNDYFDHTRYLAAKERIVTALRRRGYAYASCEGAVLVDKQVLQATMTLVAKPGPKVVYGIVEFHGNGAVPEDKLDDLINWREGEVFNPDDISTTEGRLYNTGVFASVAVHLPPRNAAVPSSAPEDEPPLAASMSASQPATLPQGRLRDDGVFVADVIINTEPSTTREIKLGGGLGIERRRQDLHLKGELTIRNFLGGLRTLRLTLRPAYAFIPAVWDLKSSGPAGLVEAQLTQPDIFGTSVTAYLLAGFDLQIQEGYQYFGPRVTPGLERTFWRDRVRVGLNYSFQFLTFFNVDPLAFNPVLTPLGLGFRNPYRLAYLEEFVSLDLRDRPIDTRAGFYAEVRAEQGFQYIGSAFTYFKLKPEVRGYIPVHPRLTIALRGTFGWMQPERGDSVEEANDSPVTRRYVLGGPSSHRGFTVGRLSPLAPSTICDNSGNCLSVPVGGHGMLLFSADIRVRVIRVAGAWLGIVPFVDAGDVTVRFSELNLARLHWATGASVVYESPIGEIRMGLGVRLNRLSLREADGTANPDGCYDTAFLKCAERFAFHLSIGGAF